MITTLPPGGASVLTSFAKRSRPLDARQVSPVVFRAKHKAIGFRHVLLRCMSPDLADFVAKVGFDVALIDAAAF
jgi:hypothetical protein